MKGSRATATSLLGTPLFRSDDAKPSDHRGGVTISACQGEARTECKNCIHAVLLYACSARRHSLLLETKPEVDSRVIVSLCAYREGGQDGRCAIVVVFEHTPPIKRRK
jgi:hypothetical protein